MVISLDCSTTAIGWAVFDNDNLIEYGRLTPSVSGLGWRDRVHNLIPQLEELLEKYKPTKIYQEDVPMGGAGGALVLIELAYVQGLLSSIEKKYCDIEYIAVGTWRKNIGINSGKDQRRNAKKIKSIEKANELFGLNLSIEYTSNGNYKENGMDDISDSILLYSSVCDKYKIKTKSFGKGVK